MSAEATDIPVAGEPGSRRKLLVLCRSAPYGNSRARDAFDVAMACGAFEQEVAMLFTGDGVLALLAAQEPPASLSRSLSKISGALADFGIAPLYVDAASLQARGIAPTELAVSVNVLDGEELRQLWTRFDQVVSV